MHPRILLASTSPYRRGLLERLGLPFETVAPPYVEEHDLPVAAEQLVVELARRKALSVAAALDAGLVIGSDQVAEVDGRVLTKPGSAEAAVRQLSALSGREHRLLTGLVVCDAATGRLDSALDVHHLRLRALSQEQLRAYVAREAPLDCAGSYKVEGLGIALFEWIRGEDFTGIIGLPLMRVVELLARFGVDPLKPG